MQEYKIEKLTQKDIQSVSSVLVELVPKQRLKEIKEHIRHDLAYKMTKDKELLAFAAIREFKSHMSLSYFFVAPKIRKKAQSLFFFMFIYEKIKHKPIYITANKNLQLYERYFEPTNRDGIYKFVGLRKDEEWAALLKR